MKTFIKNGNPTIEELYDYNNKLRIIVESAFDRDYDQNKTPFSSIVGHFFAKSYKTHKSVFILCQNYCGEDALILTRSIFEMVVTLKYILSDPTGALRERWVSYGSIEQRKMIKNARPRQRLSQRKEIEIKNIEKKAVDAQKAFRYKNRRWSDKSLFDMAKHVDLEVEYSTLYKLQCNMHHTSPLTFNDYFEPNSSGTGIITRPEEDSNYIEESLFALFHFFTLISLILAEEFELMEVKKQIDELYQEFMEQGGI